MHRFLATIAVCGLGAVLVSGCAPSSGLSAAEAATAAETTLADYLTELSKSDVLWKGGSDTAQAYATADRHAVDVLLFEWASHRGERIPPSVTSFALIDPPSSDRDAFSADVCIDPFGDHSLVDPPDTADTAPIPYVATFRPDATAPEGVRIIGLERLDPADRCR